MAKKVLGRGLAALIDDADTIGQKTSASANTEVEISKIVANPWQPRSTFDEEALLELSNSIKEMGVIQPLTLRKVNDDEFQIIAGERRFRASKMAGLTTVPAYVRELDDDKMLEMALVENIQREDLDAIEVAISYQRLIDECHLTQDNLGERVGKNRATVSNYLRLLKLPDVIQKAIQKREISMGHARALLGVDDAETQVMLYQQVVKYDFSVRKVEELVRNFAEEKTQDPDAEPKLKTKKSCPEEYESLREHLSKHFGANIGFKINNKGKGSIVIPFDSQKDLERIIGTFDKLNS